MITRHHTNKRMSQIVEYPASATLVTIAGQISDDRTLDLEGQTNSILVKIDRLLAEAGTDKSYMISAMIWLSDIRTRHDFNPIWDAWVPEGSAPVRACVEARLAEPSDLVEIQVTAYK